ncbi:hypothetical protein AMATHDRAFT_2962 [Amanita thiersii Skay4041]|uniref:RNA helicase n=1 Tax=Amanita thiersii Skay4041 TaxID=703135 RepID=A0A2A9NKK5_9AGAR|nr:hypothetical protein AMATHDRAFT_2962 [Amanita thiersii Skay4041]
MPLKRKRSRVHSPSPADTSSLDHDDHVLRELIHSSLAKRDTKSGTILIKKAKGKANLTKGELGGGSFQSMGLHPSLLRSLTLQGYRIPTPIQRLAIPALLANPPRDLVGMARTGSGKSLAYMVPLVQRLGGHHSTTFGARALILLPTRELALQIMKVGKELARGWHSAQGTHAGDKPEHASNGQNLRWGLIVGGEGMDEQFEMISNNPDVIIATPGRLLHLIVEMNLDFKSIQYVVFDEADRLFEMGFETAMNEILHRLPSARQTILLSATLPKSLVEFAKAGLQNPKLVRLDAESKISSDLRMAFFSVKQAEKDACLLNLLRDVIQVPLGGKPVIEQSGNKDPEQKKNHKYSEQITAPHQTLIFTATKHHVEYLNALLTAAGYAVSHIYGSLDQAARTQQMDRFRMSLSNLLVVTDVAARGIDIPILENVVNYDFPQGARVFVHRVGRTARAGRQGWAWSFITKQELPYLLDLQLFLGRPLRSDVTEEGDHAYIDSLILGTFERTKVDEDVEYVKSLDDINHTLPSLRAVMSRGHTMYERSKGKASPQSYKRAKEMMKEPKWDLAGAEAGIHPVLLRGLGTDTERKTKEARMTLLQAVNSFRPSETVFEIGSRNNPATTALMKERRKALSKSQQRLSTLHPTVETMDTQEDPVGSEQEAELADEDEIAAVFDVSNKKNSYRDPEFYMSYSQKDSQTEKGYSLTDGASFAEQAQSATFDLAGDEGLAERKKHQLTWDKKKKRFIKGDGTGADNVKMVKTENGTKLPATYRSGRFDEWRSKSRVSLPRVGEAENPRRPIMNIGGKKWKHTKIIPSKPLDRLRSDYDRKVRRMEKQRGQQDDQTSEHSMSGKKGVKHSRRYGDKSYRQVKSELKSVDQIRKLRKTKEQKRAKNARPSKRKSRR